MYRTPDDNWMDVAKRMRDASRSGDGGRRMVARRRKQEQGILAMGMALCALVVLVLVMFAQRVVAQLPVRQAPVALALPTSTVPVLPTLPTEPLPPVRILLLGSDQREGDPAFRTDVIVLVTIDPSGPSASAVSFPRDLWVEPPALYPMKINMVQSLGGFEAMAGMFESNFGVRPDFYVMVNFAGFTRVIDSLGGIDVEAGEGLSDRCDLPQAPDGQCTIEPGLNHMDGQTALWYARSRHTSSDYDRMRRAQEVVQAAFNRMLRLDALSRIPEIYEQLTQNLETNASLADVAPLAPVGIRLFQEPDRIQRFVINEEQATPSWSWDGMWILLPDGEAIHAVLESAGALNRED